MHIRARALPLLIPTNRLSFPYFALRRSTLLLRHRGFLSRHLLLLQHRLLPLPQQAGTCILKSSGRSLSQTFLFLLSWRVVFSASKLRQQLRNECGASSEALSGSTLHTLTRFSHRRSHFFATTKKSELAFVPRFREMRNKEER